MSVDQAAIRAYERADHHEISFDEFLIGWEARGDYIRAQQLYRTTASPFLLMGVVFLLYGFGSVAAMIILLIQGGAYNENTVFSITMLGLTGGVLGILLTRLGIRRNRASERAFNAQWRTDEHKAG